MIEFQQLDYNHVVPVQVFMHLYEPLNEDDDRPAAEQLAEKHPEGYAPLVVPFEVGGNGVLRIDGDEAILPYAKAWLNQDLETAELIYVYPGGYMLIVQDEGARALVRYDPTPPE